MYVCGLAFSGSPSPHPLLPPSTLVGNSQPEHFPLAVSFSAMQQPQQLASLTRNVDAFFPSPALHRAQAELQGALPPPGAPPGARAPINPRASCPVYAAELTTEVLSAASQQVWRV